MKSKKIVLFFLCVLFLSVSSSAFAMTQAEKDLIKLVHEHGAIDPETGRWPRNVLEEKLRMLTEGTEGARFTKEEARTFFPQRNF